MALRWHEPMRAALAEARAAVAHDDVPIGAVVVDGEGNIVARAHNERELAGDPTAHAEVLALRRAAEQLGQWRLTGHALVVTLEPCTMCAGAIVASRIDHLVFGAFDLKAGAVSSLFDVVRDPRLNHRPRVTADVMAEESKGLLRSWFATHRDRL